MEIVKGETWRDKREEILGEERATLIASFLACFARSTGTGTGTVDLPISDKKEVQVPPIVNRCNSRLLR
jgi:hypothetical protein